VHQANNTKVNLVSSCSQGKYTHPPARLCIN